MYTERRYTRTNKECTQIICQSRIYLRLNIFSNHKQIYWKTYPPVITLL